jgi:FMN-dependent NADH-azoreductase
MSTLLYVKASPRYEQSYSLAAADAFTDAYAAANPGDQITTIDLFQCDLPSFDGFAMQAKYAILGGIDPSDEERGAWQAIEAVIEEFTSADKYVFATPMWNFHLPYKLKHYIDVITQPGYTFSFSPESGYSGLVTGKPVFISYARGGEYPPGSPSEAFDFQTKYLEGWLGFIGFTDIRKLVTEPTLTAGPDAANQKKSASIETARKMAQEF